MISKRNIKENDMVTYKGNPDAKASRVMTQCLINSKAKLDVLITCSWPRYLEEAEV